MSPQDLPSEERALSAASPDRVTLSKWVNERFPPWEQLLSAHDVARLTRRPRWILAGMALLGRFPHKQRFHGRGIGWLRSDVLHWLAKDLRPTRCHVYRGAVVSSRIAHPVPLGHAPRTARRRLGTCMHVRSAHIPRNHE